MSWYPDPNQPQSQPPSGPNPYDPAQNPGQPQGQPSPYTPPLANPYGPPSEYVPSSPNPYGQPGYMPPPQNVYEQPAGYGFMPPPTAPRPLGQAIQELPRQYLKILTKPSVQAFAEEQIKADWGIIWLQLVFIGLIGTVIGIIHTLLGLAVTMPVSGTLYNGSSTAIFGTVYSLTTSGPSIFSIIAVIATFFIVVGIQYLLAKAFGGRGDFKQQGYSYLLFYVPLLLISDVLGLIPIVGLIVGFAAGIYQIVLNVFSVMAAQRLSGGKATGVVLIPIAAVIVLALLCVLAAAVLFAAAFSHSMSPTP